MGRRCCPCAPRHRSESLWSCPRAVQRSSRRRSCMWAADLCPRVNVSERERVCVGSLARHSYVPEPAPNTACPSTMALWPCRRDPCMIGATGSAAHSHSKGAVTLSSARSRHDGDTNCTCASIATLALYPPNPTRPIDRSGGMTHTMSERPGANQNRPTPQHTWDIRSTLAVARLPAPWDRSDPRCRVETAGTGARW